MKDEIFYELKRTLHSLPRHTVFSWHPLSSDQYEAPQDHWEGCFNYGLYMIGFTVGIAIIFILYALYVKGTCIYKPGRRTVLCGKIFIKFLLIQCILAALLAIYGVARGYKNIKAINENHVRPLYLEHCEYSDLMSIKSIRKLRIFLREGRACARMVDKYGGLANATVQEQANNFTENIKDLLPQVNEARITVDDLNKKLSHFCKPEVPEFIGNQKLTHYVAVWSIWTIILCGVAIATTCVGGGCCLWFVSFLIFCSMCVWGLVASALLPLEMSIADLCLRPVDNFHGLLENEALHPQLDIDVTRFYLYCPEYFATLNVEPPVRYENPWEDDFQEAIDALKPVRDNAKVLIDIYKEYFEREILNKEGKECIKFAEKFKSLLDNMITRTQAIIDQDCMHTRLHFDEFIEILCGNLFRNFYLAFASAVFILIYFFFILMIISRIRRYFNPRNKPKRRKRSRVKKKTKDEQKEADLEELERMARMWAGPSTLKDELCPIPECPDSCKAYPEELRKKHKHLQRFQCSIDCTRKKLKKNKKGAQDVEAQPPPPPPPPVQPPPPPEPPKCVKECYEKHGKLSSKIMGFLGNSTTPT